MICLYGGVTKEEAFVRSYRAIALLAFFLFASSAQANIYPPTATAHFFGDADGDTAITNLDIGQHNNTILGRTATYETLQPAGPNTPWNTCDVNSDREDARAQVPHSGKEKRK